MPDQCSFRVGERKVEPQAKVMHLGAAFAGTRAAALRRVTRLHTATHVHC